MTEATRMSQASQSRPQMSQFPYQHRAKPLGHRNLRHLDKAADFHLLIQWKSQLDANAPWWKQLWFKYVYRPFNEFSRFKLGIPSYAGEDREGRLWWFDLQGAVKEEWEAISIAHSKGKNWGYAGVKVGLLPDESTNIMTKFDYPASDIKTRQKYWRSQKPQVVCFELNGNKAKAEGR